MKTLILMVTLALVPVAFARSESGAQAGGSANLEAGTEVHASLDDAVDASKNKPGDRVVATATQDVKSNGRVVVRKGSRLIGHVTEAKPHSKDKAKGNAEGRSELGIVFDHAILRDGTKVPLNATLQAVASARGAASGELRDADSQRPMVSGSPGRNEGSLGGAVSGTVGGAVSGASGSVGAAGNVGRGVVTRSAGAVGGLSSTGRLHAGSRGVFGMKHLEITSAASGSAQGNVVTSDSGDVRLSGGTQMLLTTGATAGKQTADAGGTEARRDAAEAKRDTR